jgi:hypothetical protein
LGKIEEIRASYRGIERDGGSLNKISKERKRNLSNTTGETSSDHLNPHGQISDRLILPPVLGHEYPHESFQ